jgi:hypothetical protein
METICTMENDRRRAASYCIDAMGRGRQEVDLSIAIGLVRDRQCAIQKQHMTTKGGSGLMTGVIIQLIKRFIMRLPNIYTHM